jgi:signal transduction histidine kinase
LSALPEEDRRLAALLAENALLRDRVRALETADAAARRREAQLPRRQRLLFDLSRGEALERVGLDAVLERLLRAAAEGLDVDRVAIWLYDAAHDAIRAERIFDRRLAEPAPGMTARRDAAPRYFAALDAERTIDASDACADPRTSEFADSYLRPAGVGALLDAPIRVFGAVHGVVCHEHVGGPRTWSPEDAAFAGAVADLAALALEEEHRRVVEDRLFAAEHEETLGGLAAATAHDFNNLLTVIGNHAETAAKKAPPYSPAAKAGEEILVALGRAGEIVDQLLRFARRGAARTTAVDLGAVVRETVRLLRAGFPRGIALVVDDGGATAPSVAADFGRVQQVLLNLLLNARDALGASGRIEIGVRTALAAPAQARDRASAGPGPFGVLSVVDDGPGVAPEHLPRLFQPFFTTKGERGGGLGLAGAASLVRRFGGCIAVRSEPGRGATFEVYLPLAAAASGASDASAQVAVNA